MFSRRIPTFLLPKMEALIDQELQDVIGGEWELVILPAAHLDTYLLTGEGDETPTIHPSEDDNG